MTDRDASAYKVMVAVDVMKNMRWQKTPGKDEITAQFASEDDFMVASPVLFVMSVKFNPYTYEIEEHPENDAIDVNRDNLKIAIRGEEAIRFFVSQVRPDFNGIDAYRGNDKGIS